jgi:hypothetical protein
MRRGLLRVLFAAAAILASSAPARASELDRASNAVHGDKKSAPSQKQSSGSSSSSSSTSDTSDDTDGSGEGSVMGAFVFRALMVPWSIPYYAIEDDETVSHDFSFQPYPYAAGAPGYLKRAEPPVLLAAEGDEVAPAVSPPVTRKVVAGQLRFEESYLTSALFRTGGLARLLLPYRLELDTEWSLFADPNARTARYAGLGAAHLGIRFAQSEHVIFRTGIGSRHWIDAQGAEYGADLLYGVDVFWGRPVTTTLEGDVGFVGEAFVGRVRGTVGATLGPVEVFAGYDHVGILGDGLGAALGGPLIGLRAFL